MALKKKLALESCLFLYSNICKIMLIYAILVSLRKENNMKTKSEMSRITLDIPKAEHKKLKAKAALLGKSMRSLVLEALEGNNECSFPSHTPNRATKRAIKNAEEGKNLTHIEDLTVLAKKFGL